MSVQDEKSQGYQTVVHREDYHFHRDHGKRNADVDPLRRLRIVFQRISVEEADELRYRNEKEPRGVGHEEKTPQQGGGDARAPMSGVSWPNGANSYPRIVRWDRAAESSIEKQPKVAGTP
ncbi:hypothetical protein CSOJ01_12861 [Colletotrichum sojae]|uniref:Uncharacterized protein n=1 Tax=Colletotrichum sojae TaxID=2175907 RepID=A0A8H6MM36_9PEZI|nr:hypothetical protein CSOJ01_12861 [Colletotrichum sojae]